MNEPTIYSYIKKEEASFQTDEIQLGDNWNWNFRDHVQLIFHLKNGVFFTGQNNWLRAFKNIMDPLLNLAYWTEDIEVKDVLFFIEEQSGRVLSFLIKKYHDEVYVRENDLDTLFDEITESDLDYGGVLVQKTNTGRPEVLQLNSIAFCDQTDIMGGPLFFKHNFSPSKLREMSKLGWGDKKNGATISIDELCLLSQEEKAAAGTMNGRKNKVPGKTIEVYIGRGNLPEGYLSDSNDMEYYCNQLQIVAFYTNKENKQEGVTLYRKEDDGESLKFHTSKKVHGRALGRGEGESLVHPQIWTNFLTIHKMNLMEAASKIPLYTDDAAYQNRNKIQDMENLEITTIEDGKQIRQVPTAAPANIQLFEGAINEWFEHSQLTVAAFDPLLGKEGNSGTTFRGQAQTVSQGRGLHDRRRGQRAKFIELLYRDYIIPDIVKQILKGKKFLATLSLEELTWVSDQLSAELTNQKIREALLKGKIIPKEQQDAMIQAFKQDFAKKGTKHLLEILKTDFKDIEVKMGINIAGKQKDLVALNDKLLSIFQAAFANPQGFIQTMQIPGMGKSFNDILEFSGISQIDFAQIMAMPAPAPTDQPQDPAQPLQIKAPQPQVA